MRKMTIDEVLNSSNIKFRVTPEQLNLIFKKVGCDSAIIYNVCGVGFKNSYDGYCTTNHYFYDGTDWLNLEEVELIEEQNVFNSQQAVWEYLFSGGKVFKEMHVYFILDSLLVCRSINSKELERVGLINFSDYHEWKPYIESEKEWWELNNNEPTLCWVSDIECNSKDCTAIVYRVKDKFKQLNSNCWWEYAIPLTNEELEKYRFKPTK